MPDLKRSQKTKPSFGASLIARYIKFVWRRNAIIYEPEHLRADLEKAHPLIVSVWHGQFLLVPLLRPENIDARVLVAKHGDAKLIGEVMEQLGSNIILGAGAGHKKVDKGGKAALVAALKALKNDISVVLTADVPPGPARKVGLGIITMAKLSGKPIMPIAIATKRYKSAKSWSRFTLNFPFTKQAVVKGAAIIVPKTARGADLEIYRSALELEMVRITARAYTLAESDILSSMPLAYREVTKPSFGLRAYSGLMTIAQPLAPLILSRRLKKGKEDPKRIPERYGFTKHQRPEGFLIWFHCASVGETNAVLPLISDLLERNESDSAAQRIEILLTTMTSTSAKLATQRLPKGARHQFVPLDVPKFVDRFFAHWAPNMAVFVESEIWPNLVLGASKRAIPLLIVNGIMSKKSFRKWRKKEAMAQGLFGRFDMVLAQNEDLALWYHRLGAKNIKVVGNLKLDAPPPPVDKAALENLKSSVQNRKVFLAASTHNGEDAILAQAHTVLKQRFPDLLTIIVPRHPERGEAIEGMLKSKDLLCARRALSETLSAETDIYIADTIGELGLFYSLAPIAFIGGSLVENGGQNPIEAIKLDTVVLTGPHYFNQNQYHPLFAAKAVIKVTDAAEIVDNVEALFLDEARCAKMKARAVVEIEKIAGAKAKTRAVFEEFIDLKA